ncbi:MAG: YceI family protein [Spirochaetales bacterium]|nr:YceI family protein [Spirochaetales bacterium]
MIRSTLLFFLIASQVAALDWAIQTGQSSISFEVEAKTQTVQGTFKKYRLSSFDYRGQPGSLKGSISIDTGSVYTKNTRRDNHLRQDDFFHSEKFPEATVTVLEVLAGETGPEARVVLRIRDREKEYRIEKLQLETTARRVRARGMFLVNRMDFDLTGNILENQIMDDEVLLSFDLLLEKLR